MTKFSNIYKLATVLVVCGVSMFIAVGVQMAVWAFDREPPFKLVSYTSQATRKGDLTVATLKVKRDLTRNCSLTYSRMFIDSEGVMWDLTEGTRPMTAKALQELNSRSPDSLTVKIRIPSAASSGVGSIMSILEYVCNPVQQMYPVPVVVMIDVEVLP